MPTTAEEALSSFDRTAAAAEMARAEERRLAFLALFPESEWPSLPLERYALGQGNSAETFCRWVEFKTPGLGSISGGSAVKHIIYKHKDKPGWYFPQSFADEQDAWAHLRRDVVTMLERAHSGRWDELAELMPFQYGPALWLKTLHLYMPKDVLAVYSREHLGHFLYRLTGEAPREARQLGAVVLNRLVMERLRDVQGLRDFSPLELSYFLYHWDDPRAGTSIYKIAPGEEGRLWDECLAGQYICVGWPKVGDLSAFENFQEFEDRFRQDYAAEYGDTPAGKATLTRKAKELWRLREIQPRDLILANQGTSRLLGVGEVQDPAYEWGGEQNEYPHRVRVNWDTTAAGAIPAQKKWAFVTVAPIPLEEYERLLKRGGGGKPPVPSVSDPELARLGERLEERKQLILYGPPGTGKTYTARRFLLHWLLSAEGVNPGEILADPERSRREWARLSEGGAASTAQVTTVTFHPSYGYEDFVEGFRPADSSGGGLRLELQDGVFKRTCKAAAAADSGKRFVLLIDEINRGNLPRIFGELITVIEADKRGLEVTLPQSKEKFAVPENVYIVGTMNTADRSIRVLDAAVRRRFAFHELLPDSTLLSGRQFGDLVLEDFLDYLNDLIRKKEGREKQIGHAVFMDVGEAVDDAAEFAKRFRYEVVPLLQEYCYEDYGALAHYLGPELVDVAGQRLRTDLIEQPEALAAALARLINPRGAE